MLKIYNLGTLDIIFYATFTNLLDNNSDIHIVLQYNNGRICSGTKYHGKYQVNKLDVWVNPLHPSSTSMFNFICSDIALTLIGHCLIIYVNVAATRLFPLHIRMWLYLDSIHGCNLKCMGSQNERYNVYFWIFTIVWYFAELHFGSD